jgi:hypothetical protein
MKRWLRSDEWSGLAACGGSDLHTVENPSESQVEEAAAVCARCIVRPECIQWAVRDNACAVFVAGVYLPDPHHKKELKKVYNLLKSSLPMEFQLRGDLVD